MKFIYNECSQTPLKPYNEYGERQQVIIELDYNG